MRSRNIKPGLFKNEILGVEDPMITIAFIGLWCMADREGILEDRPLRLKAEIFPYRENIDFNGYLTVMSRLGFIRRYEVQGSRYIYIENFAKHQQPHHTEKKSTYPKPPVKSAGCCLTVDSPLINGENPPDSLIPDSLIPDSLIQNIGPLPKPPDKKEKKFTKPTREQVREYSFQRNSHVNPDQFYDHYESNGWKVGKNPMKDWQAAFRYWETSSNGKKPTTGSRLTDNNIQAALEFIHGK